MERWKEYFEELMNDEYERKRRVEVDQEVVNVIKEKVVKRMKKGM